MIYLPSPPWGRGRRPVGVKIRSFGGPIQSPWNGRHHLAHGASRATTDGRNIFHSAREAGDIRNGMSHTYTNILIHALFSTKDRQPSLTLQVREEIFNYLGGAINALGGQSVLVNGPRDHVHLLFVQPRTLSIAEVMEKVKANSSGWVKGRWPEQRHFGWQAGQAAFSVRKSHAEHVKRYVRNQEGHHRKISLGGSVPRQTRGRIRSAVCFRLRTRRMTPASRARSKLFRARGLTHGWLAMG